ncbi:hypothetical protein G9A89_021528 [Geosiphon pyriformis]|nr:hypothetical protein G9A89_021528 [Geosiphon pyriformis]
MVNKKAGAAVIFEDIGLGLGIGVMSLMSFILAKMQAIVLALDKNLRVFWLKVKDHSNVLENEHANALVNATSFSNWDNVWLICAKHYAYIEKNGLILLDKSAFVLVFGLTSELLASVIRLLGIIEAFGVYFGFYRPCLFFSDIDVLVTTRRIVPRYLDLTTEEISDLFVSAQKIGKVIETEYKGSSLTLAIQDGPAAGQTVPHCHIHVIPRRFGDWANNDDIYKEIDRVNLDNLYNTTAIKVDNEERKPRTWEEMAKEAAYLRQFFDKPE